jgi:hypothetical protein
VLPVNDFDPPVWFEDIVGAIKNWWPIVTAPALPVWGLWRYIAQRRAERIQIDQRREEAEATEIMTMRRQLSVDQAMAFDHVRKTNEDLTRENLTLRLDLARARDAAWDCRKLLVEQVDRYEIALTRARGFFAVITARLKGSAFELQQTDLPTFPPAVEIPRFEGFGAD